MLLHGDSLQILKDINNESIDLIVTDPPYGIEFMGKDWDKALPSIDIWKECFRVLKTGKLAFVMCSPRQDVLSRMIISLEDAGFRTNYTSIYWTYASGFPKAANVSKLIDKKFKKRSEYEQLAEYLKLNREESQISIKELAKLFPSKTGGLTGCVWNWENAENVPTEQQYKILKDKLNLDNRFDWLIEQETKRYEEAEREIIGKRTDGRYKSNFNPNVHKSAGFGAAGDVDKIGLITKPATEEAKKMEGAYVGFQPKPAVEVILVVSKGKTISWLDDCRIPYSSDSDLQTTSNKVNKDLDKWEIKEHGKIYGGGNGLQRPNIPDFGNEKGRFPANLLVSDDVLNDGVERISKYGKQKEYFSDSESHLTFCNKKEKTIEGVNKFVGDSGSYSRYFDLDKWFSKTFPFLIVPKASKGEKNQGVSNDVKVNHPTIKPLKLFSYLITMGSRENDLILDPFCGSGTTLIAADNLSRKYIGIEINKDYLEIAKHRLLPHVYQTKLNLVPLISEEQF